MKKVAILQHRLLHYRTGMFDALRKLCAERDIELVLVHGQATRRELVKRDEGHLPWAIRVENKVWEVGDRDVIWQPFPLEAQKADLVILMQESRILSNYPLLLSRAWGNRKIAYWGHGKNFQSDAPKGIRESWKNLLLKQVDWWFAYTNATTEILKSAGFPANRITQLNNAIDTTEFKNDLESISDQEIAETQRELGISPDAQVGLFCGSLYPDKRLDLMIEASDQIQRALSDFHLIVIGDGPSMAELRAKAETRPWIHILGIKKGRQKARYFRLSQVMLNPGLVGLHVVDAFCAGMVMVTTADARHSPEVSYLTNEVNGLVVEGGANDYSSQIIDLFRDKKIMSILTKNSTESALIFSLDNMIQNFVNGIEKALK